MTTSLVVFAALAGLGGLALGAYALTRTRAVLGDCRDLVHRLLPDGSGLDARAVRDVAVVRYDALEEMSGARSFSLAMLNASGDGVVVTSINGRTESRTYAKTIEQGRAAEALSPEEYRAIRSARLGQTPGSIVPDEPAAAPPAPRSGNGDAVVTRGAEDGKRGSDGKGGPEDKGGLGGRHASEGKHASENKPGRAGEGGHETGDGDRPAKAPDGVSADVSKGAAAEKGASDAAPDTSTVRPLGAAPSGSSGTAD